MRPTCVAAGLVLAVLLALAQPAAGMEGAPSTAARTVRAARAEGRVVVYAATDRGMAAPLLADFHALYPDIAVDYQDLTSKELHDRFLREAAAGEVAADVLWSPAMDLQLKLANDGFAAAYDSREIAGLPPWAVWRNEAFGTTLEPFVFIYDGRALPAGEAPLSHAELVRALEAQPARWRGRIATYDPVRSGLGYLLLTQDGRIDPGFLDTLRAYGAAEPRLRSTTRKMIDDVLAGRALLAFNVVGSYALQARRASPGLAVVFPRDYVLAMARIALIPRAAPHPAAARVFLDYLISARGQQVLATRCALFSIRNDVEGEFTAVALSRELGARLKPIHVGPSLLVFLDQAKREDFLRRWRAALAAAPGRDSAATGSPP